MMSNETRKSIMDEIVEESKEVYGTMSLLELFREENIMARLLHAGKLDPVWKRLQKSLQIEIEKKLR